MSSLKFCPSELPNPYLLTAPENLEYMRKKEEEQAAKKAKKGKGVEKMTKEVAIAAAVSAVAAAVALAEKEKDVEGEKEVIDAILNELKKRKTTTSKDAEVVGEADKEIQLVMTKKRKTAGKKKDAETPTSLTKASVPGVNDLTSQESDSSQSTASTSTAIPIRSLYDIELDGDDDGTVEIYDSCDEIRDKINHHLTTSSVTKAAFLRDIARAAYPAPAPRIQSKQLTDFLSYNGPTRGSTSRVFYAAYVYFEKKRLFEDKPKSEHREDMEDRWAGEGGLPRERERAYIVGVGTELVQDELGGLRSVPMY